MQLRSMFVTLRAALVMVALVAAYALPSASAAHQQSTPSEGSTAVSAGFRGGVRSSSDAFVLALEADGDDAEELEDDDIDDADEVDDDTDDVDDDDTDDDT